MTLKVAPCSREAATYAVMQWHYSKVMPSGRLIHFGVWEHGHFIGTVIFGRGANKDLVRPYGLKQTEGCELVRVALTAHDAPVSQIIAVTLRELKRTNPGMRLIVSFADPEQNHHGGIYQAGNWIYAGTSASTKRFTIHGKEVHNQTVSQYGTASLTWIRANIDPAATARQPPPKHRYIMPLDKPMRRKIMHLAKPYPSKVDS